MADDLLTLAEYKALAGITVTDNDAQVAALLPVASRMIRSFADRTFEVTAGVVTPRVYEYDGSGFLDIEDCTTVASVSSDLGIAGGDPYVLDVTEWSAQPSSGPIYYYLRVYGGFRGWGSPEMGFERNLDTYGGPYSYKPISLTVTAQWGWPEVPQDVKLATVWTIQDWFDREDGEGLTGESIADYSRSWGSKAGLASPAQAVPSRVQDILAAYERIYV
jgi:hypothetical protein